MLCEVYSDRFLYYYAECHYAECHYAECCCAECRGAPYRLLMMRGNSTFGVNLTKLFYSPDKEDIMFVLGNAVKSALIREVLLKWKKAQYGWPPCTNKFRLALYYWKYNFPFYKTSYLNEEVDCT